MVNSQKSKCQLRLEARARSRGFHIPLSSHEKALLAENLDSRHAKAQLARQQSQYALKATASARVQHAQRVARDFHAHQQLERIQGRIAFREKVDIARARRRSQLQELQRSCQLHILRVSSTVATAKDIAKEQRLKQLRTIEIQLQQAQKRREKQMERVVRKLSERWHTVEQIKARVARVKFIQRWYRRHVDARKNAIALKAVAQPITVMVKCWKTLGTPNLAFEQAMRMLQVKNIIRAAQAVQRVLLPLAQQHAPAKESALSPRTTSYRVLLMAGMLASHPQEIMETNTCEKLAFAAKSLVKDMQALQRALVAPMGTNTSQWLKTCVARIEARYIAYFSFFIDWKDRDAERLAAEMLSSYQDILRTKVSYSMQAKSASEQVDGIHELLHQTDKQLAQLRNALQQVIGKEAADLRISTLDSNLEASVSSNSTIMNNEQSNVVDPIAELLSNESLAHELILNRSLNLHDIPIPTTEMDILAQRFRKTMVDAYWKQLLEMRDVDALIRQANELRITFAEMLPLEARTVVSNAMDESAWRTLLTEGNKYGDDYMEQLNLRCRSVVQVLLAMEAPARNPSTHAFLQKMTQGVSDCSTVEDEWHLIVEFIAFMMGKIDDFRHDLSASHVDGLKQYLAVNGVQYEQEKLRQKISNGVKFPNSHKWLSRTWSQYQSIHTNVNIRESNIAFMNFLTNSIFSIITNGLQDGELWPETLELDGQRMQKFRDIMDRISLSGALVVMLRELIPQQSLEDLKSFVNTLNVLLQSHDITAEDIIAHVINVTNKFKNEVVEDTMTLFHQRIATLLNESTSHPVVRILFRRLSMTVLNSLEKMNEGKSLTTECHPSLNMYITSINDLCGEVCQFVKHHQQVYSQLVYHDMLKDITQNSQ